MTGSSTQKNALRRQILSRRERAARSQPPSIWGPQQKHRVLQHLFSLHPSFSGPILSFFPINDELQVLPPAPDVEWFFPKVVGQNLEWFGWSPCRPLPPRGRFGIHEAETSTPAEKLFNGPVLVFVPALAVDSKGQRLGYGGGFYDRFLSQSFAHQQAITACCVTHEFSNCNLPVEAHDVAIDLIATEESLNCTCPLAQLLCKLRTKG